MKNLKSLLYDILNELNQGHIVSIFFGNLASQNKLYGEPMYIDYTKHGFTRSNILGAIRELERLKKIKIIDSQNMGWWIEPYTAD